MFFRIGADLQVKAQEVKFGNLIKHNSFLTHYTVDQNPKEGWYGTPQMMQEFLSKESQVKIVILNK